MRFPTSLPTATPAVFALALAALAPTVPLPARAAHFYWTNAAGGIAGVNTNWSPVGVPGAADIGHFDLAGAFNVYWALPADTLSDLMVTAGRPRFNVSGRIGVDGTAQVNAESLTVLSGPVRAGVWSVTRATTARVLATGNTTRLEARDSTGTSYLGTFGDASLLFQGGASLRSNGRILMAAQESDVCSLTVIGFSGTPRTYSSVRTLSNTGGGGRGDLAVGLAGTGYLGIANGGVADIAGNLLVSGGSYSHGQVRTFLSGTGNANPSLTVRGETRLGSAASLDGYFGAGELSAERGYLTLMGPTTIRSGGLVARNGTVASLADVTLSVKPACFASLAVIGAGTTGTIASSLTIGTSTSGLFHASVVADSGATLACTGAAPVSIGNDGALYVQHGAAFQSAGDVLARGNVSVQGLFTAPRLHLNQTGGDFATLSLNPTTDFRAALEMDEGSTAFLYTDLAVGDSASSAGFVSHGDFLLYGHTLTALDQDGAEVGDVALGGGTLRLPKGGRSAAGDTLAGPGRVEGDWTNGGVLACDDSVTVSGALRQQGGEVVHSGTLRLAPGSTLSAFGSVAPATIVQGSLDLGLVPSKLVFGATLDLSGATGTRLRIGAGGIQDSIVVAGAATLGGVLELATWPPAVAPGDTLTLLVAGSVSGQFSAVTLDGAPATGLVTVLYEPTRVRVVRLGPVAAVEPAEAPIAALRMAPLGGPHQPAFSLELPHSAHVRVSLFDVMGREVAALASGAFAAGRHHLPLPHTRLSSGVYFGRAVVTNGPGVRTLVARTVLAR